MSWVAFFLTWHTYGTWLHGDDRGSVNTIQNAYGTPRVPAHAKTLQAAAARMKQPPFTLSREMRAIVAEAIRDHAKIRRWSLITLSVRSNHVHVILRPPTSHDADAVMAQFKSWGTRRLISAGLATSETRVWVDHGSTRYLDTDESLRRAVEYVSNQGPELEPSAPAEGRNNALSQGCARRAPRWRVRFLLAQAS